MKANINGWSFIEKSLTFVLVGLMIISNCFNNFVYANTKEQIIQYRVEYTENNTKANIIFDLNTVDQTKYEINKITNVKDDAVIYDKNFSDNSLQYEVKENGDYVFSVEFVNKVSATEEEKEISAKEQYATEEIKISIDNIVKKETTNSTVTDNEVVEETVEKESVEPKTSTDNNKLSENSKVRDTKIGNYNNGFEIHGQGSNEGGEVLQTKRIGFDINYNSDTKTYTFKHNFIDTNNELHHDFASDTCVEIYVIKKGSTLENVDKKLLFSAKGSETGTYELTTFESYQFEAGDMLVLRDPYFPAFHITGDPVIGSDGKTQIDYNTNRIDFRETTPNSVYLITEKGIQEIYNAAPVISGADEPLYITYGDDDSVDSLLRKGVTATDDRDATGKYVSGGVDYTQSIKISGAPESTKDVGTYYVKYTVTDNWGKKSRTTTVTRKVVVSNPYPHQISIFGEGSKVGNQTISEKIIFSINPDTFDITPTLVHSQPMHTGYSNDEYVRISVIKKGSTLNDAKQEVVFSSLGKNSGQGGEKNPAYDFDTISSYDFEEGDMLVLTHYKHPAFHIDGGNVIGSDGGVGPNYDKANPSGEFQARISEEKMKNSVYEITRNGLKEVYNAEPVIEGTEKPLFIQYGFKGNIDSLLNKGLTARDDRDSTGKYVSGGVDYTSSITAQVEKEIDSNKPGFYKVKYNVIDSWGRGKDVFKERYVVVLPNYNKLTIEGMTFNADGTVDFDEDVTIDPINNKVTLSNGIELYTKNGTNDVIVKVPYQSKNFSIKNAMNVILPDQAEVQGNRIKTINIKKDKSSTISTDYLNHAKKETSLTIDKNGNIRYPIEAYVNSIQFNDGTESDPQYIDIAKAYSEKDLTKYIQSEQPIRISFAIWNPIPVSTNDISTYLTIKNLSIDDKWMDVLKVVGSDGKTFEIPPKGQGELITSINWNSIVKASSEKYYINCDVALQANTNLDIIKYQNSSLPLVKLEALLTDKDQKVYGDIIKSTLAVVSVPIVEGKNVTWSILEDGNSLGQGYAQFNLGLARSYDDTILHALNIVNNYNLKIIDEVYKVYDFKTSKWINSSQEEFESLVKAKDEPTIYSYRFTVKDNRRSGLNYDIDNPLQTSDTSYLFAANKSVSSNDKKTFIMTNGKDAVLSETQIVALNETEIIDELINQTSLKAVQINGDNIKELTATDLNIEFDSSYKKSNPKEGIYDVTVSCGSGDSQVTTIIKLNITSNTWSYDTPDRTEENGASGFIVIPKYVELEKTPSENKISQTCEVYFANYSGATEVKYNLSVDKTFEMINTDDPNNKFNVISSSDGAQVNDNKLFIGEINNTNTKNNGKFITFSASSEVPDKTKGRWEGMVTFYFERK